nr:C2 calcium-dependent membrane targeting [Tanacetum cinerariifolium]
MAYVNGSKCSSFNVIRKRPPTLGWTSELLREREDEKLNYGGFGFGEIEGLFVEQEDPMPDNIEKKSRFEKTLDAAEYIFPGKLAGFFERYIDALKYQGCRKEGSGNAYISYANRAADAQADRQNNKGASFVSVQAMIGEGEISLGDEHADIGMDQEDAKIERRKWFDMSDIPSFSLGLTQEYGHLDQDVVTPVATTQEPNLASKISNPVPLRVCPPGTAVGRLRRDTDKRPVTICEVRKSPFIGRVVDANGSLNAEKKRVTKYLFEVLEDHRFQSFMGYVVNAIENKGKCELLKDIDVIFIPVDNGGHIFLFVVDLKNSRPLLIDHEKNEKIIRKRVKDIIGTSRRFWTISNGEKSYKSWNFIGTEIEVGEFDWQTNSMETEAGIFVMRHMETCMGMGMDELNCCLNNTEYNNLRGREGRFQSFMGYVVNAIENKRKCELLKDIDVIFIPVDNGGHKFLFVADLKNSRPLLIDHEKNEKIVRKRVKKKIRACENLTVAAMLDTGFRLFQNVV